MERFIEFNRDLYQLFIDFRQAFDLIWRKGLWHILRHYGVPDEIVRITEDMYNQFKSQILTTDGLSGEFPTTSGVLQGCIFSPHLFNLFLHAILSLIPVEYGVRIGGILIDKLAYADDIVQMSTTAQELQRQADCISQATKPFCMQINANKTKIMVTSRQEITNPPPRY